MPSSSSPAPTLHDLAERVERLLLRHAELERTNKLLRDEVEHLNSERDNLKARLGTARSRIDALLERLPADAGPASQPPPSSPSRSG